MSSQNKILTVTETSSLIPKSDIKSKSIIQSRLGSVEDGLTSEDDSPEEWSDGARDQRVNVDSAPLSRRTSAEGRQKLYEGLPEVRKKMKYLFPALALGVFLAAADQSIIISSYSRIGSELNALSETSWIATGYFLTVTSFQPLYGKLSDVFGRKSCLLFAYFMFGLGCLFCGLAQDINQLIVARAFAGVGGGGIPTVVAILLSDVIPLKDRGTWQGYVNIIYSTGAAAGAPLGGFLADGIGWRWSFLGQVPLCLVAFAAVALTLQLPEKEGDTHWRTKFPRVDMFGSAVLIAAVFALLLGLDRGSNGSWHSKACLIPLCISIPAIALFVYVEAKVASEPIAPSRVLFSRSLFAGFLCSFFSMAGWLSAWFYLPSYYQAVRGYTATQASFLLIPATVGGLFGSLSAGYYMQRTGKYASVTIGTYSSLVLSMLLVLLLSGILVDSVPGVAIAAMVCAFSQGFGATTTLIALISNAKHDDQATVTACSFLFRSLGSTVGLSVTSTVANQALRSALVGELGSGEKAIKIIEEVRRSLSYLKTLDPDATKTVRHCFALSVRAAFGLDTAMLVGAAVSAWFIREKPLSG